MKIVIAPDSFKESLSAPAAAEAIAHGVRQAFPGAQTLCVPMADGGEGTVQAVLAAFPGAKITEIRTPEAMQQEAAVQALPEVEDEWDPFEDS